MLSEGRLPLPNCMERSIRPRPKWEIKDYDVFYYDGEDLTWEAEDRVYRSVSDTLADLPIRAIHLSRPTPYALLPFPKYTQNMS